MAFGAHVREALRVFLRARGRVLGASVAFYAMLSVAPMLLIALVVAGTFARDGSARSTLVAELARWVGTDGAATIGTLVDRAGHASGGAASSVAGACVVIYSATRLFSALEYALDAMWGVRERASGDLKDKAIRQLRKRGAAFVVAFVLAIVLLVLQGLRTALAVVATWAHVASPNAPDVSRATEAGVSFVVTTSLFFFLFKTLPSARIGGRDALVGATVTAALFTAGTAVVGAYIAARDLARAWGDASAIVVLLLWVHYSAQIFLLGAAYTGARARASGTLKER